MAAYVATHDRSVLPNPLEETKVTATQTTTHKDILGKLIYFNQSLNLIKLHKRKLYLDRLPFPQSKVKESCLHRLHVCFLPSVIGNELYQRTIDGLEKEKQQNVSEVEQRAWRLASEEKARALKEAREAAEIELEKAMAAAKKAQVSDSQGSYKVKG